MVASMLDVGVIGTGAIGTNVVRYLEDGVVPGVGVAIVYNRTPERAHGLVNDLGVEDRVTVAEGPLEVATESDVVVEVASQTVIEANAADILATGTDMIIMSIGALRDAELLRELQEVAEANDAHLYGASGAIAALDGIGAIGLGAIDHVTLECYRPPYYLGAYLPPDRSTDDLEEGEVIFTGTASEAAAAFPSHMNVAITLTLAAKLDPEDVSIHVEVDMDAPRSHYVISAHGEAGAIDVEIQNFRTPEDPDQSLLNVFSVLERLNRMVSPVTIGT